MNTNYKEKYLKYKSKYLKLKEQKGGANSIIGINFEGGKIINHIKKYPNCIAYANLQIAMDAPYHGRVADDSVRKEGRSEKFFPGYDESYLIRQLTTVFNYIKDNYPDTKKVIQIARGKAAVWTRDEILIPLFDDLKIKNYEFVFGYRCADYYSPEIGDEDFVFINYGMFAVLTDVEHVQVAEICNPDTTLNIVDYKDNKMVSDYKISTFNDDKNILNKLDFKHITLAGIADRMKFIVPKDYSKESMDDLIENIKNRTK